MAQMLMQQLPIDDMIALKDVMSNLNDRDQAFAKSLIDQYQKRQNLSDKQWYWVKELARKGVEDDSSGTGKGPEVSYNFCKGFEAILPFFQKAYDSGIEYPTMRFESFRIIGKRGAEILRVVSEETNDYGKRKYLGKIDSEGTLLWTKGTEMPAPVRSALNLMCESPNEAVKIYGRRTGNCCLCGRTLTNHESIELGIGPICASKWGV